MAQNRLSKEDWLAAGFRALAQGGHAALRVEAIARELKTTKGSFYWHFKDLRAYKSEMLLLWKSRATEAIIAGLEPLEPGHERLVALIAQASHTPQQFGGHAVEPAIRDWAQTDADVAAALDEIDTRRIAFLHDQLSQMGISEIEDARLFYAAHIGLEQLARATGHSGESERRRLLSWMQQQ